MSKATSLLVTVSVIGALVIGGALTGTTLALWRDQAPLAAGQVQSGSIALSVNGTATASLGALNGLQPGVAQVVSANLTNSSPAAAKNLRMQVHLDSVSSSNPALDAVLEASVSTTTGSCVAAGAGFKPVGSGYSSTQLTSNSLAAQTSVTLCVTLRLPSSAPPAALGQSGTLTFTFRGEQVRP
jgi:hypothetical protein